MRAICYVLAAQALLTIQLLPVGHTFAQRLRAREVLVVSLYPDGYTAVDPSSI